MDAAPGSTAAAGFARLVADAQACRACPRMEGRRRLLGASCGPLAARLLVVATAPGRLGGDRTGVPLSGDRSGEVFEVLLREAGIGREQVFVTNAVICNPRDARGRNDQPSAAELRACRSHLRRTLELVRSPLVVTLGRVAHDAVVAATGEPGAPRFGACLGRPRLWAGRRWIASYHPGPRVANVPGRRARLRAHWEAVAACARETGEGEGDPGGAYHARWQGGPAASPRGRGHRSGSQEREGRDQGYAAQVNPA